MRRMQRRDELTPFHQQILPCFEAEDTTAGELLHCGISTEPLSALGQERTSPTYLAMSALLLKADKQQTCRNVRFVPIADIRIAAKRCSPRYNRQLPGKMPEAQMNREAVLVIAELMWALRCLVPTKPV